MRVALNQALTGLLLFLVQERKKQHSHNIRRHLDGEVGENLPHRANPPLEEGYPTEFLSVAGRDGNVPR